SPGITAALRTLPALGGGSRPARRSLPNGTGTATQCAGRPRLRADPFKPPKRPLPALLLAAVYVAEHLPQADPAIRTGFAGDAGRLRHRRRFAQTRSRRQGHRAPLRAAAGRPARPG